MKHDEVPYTVLAGMVRYSEYDDPDPDPKPAVRKAPVVTLATSDGHAVTPAKQKLHAA